MLFHGPSQPTPRPPSHALTCGPPQWVALEGIGGLRHGRDSSVAKRPWKPERAGWWNGGEKQPRKKRQGCSYEQRPAFLSRLGRLGLFGLLTRKGGGQSEKGGCVFGFGRACLQISMPCSAWANPAGPDSFCLSLLYNMALGGPWLPSQ
jgi:hypothetical protein